MTRSHFDQHPPIAAVARSARSLIHVVTGTALWLSGPGPRHDFADAPSSECSKDQWSFRRAARAVVGQRVDVQYVGSNTSHLDRSFFNNTPQPGEGAVDPRRPNPRFRSRRIIQNDLIADYDAVSVIFRRRMSQGLQADVHYTWSRTRDMATDSNGGGQTMNNYDIWADYGPANGTCRTVVASYLYEVAFLKDSSQPIRSTSSLDGRSAAGRPCRAACPLRHDRCEGPISDLGLQRRISSEPSPAQFRRPDNPGPHRLLRSVGICDAVAFRSGTPRVCAEGPKSVTPICRWRKHCRRSRHAAQVRGRYSTHQQRQLRSAQRVFGSGRSAYQRDQHDVSEHAPDAVGIETDLLRCDHETALLMSAMVAGEASAQGSTRPEERLKERLSLGLAALPGNAPVEVEAAPAINAVLSL